MEATVNGIHGGGGLCQWQLSLTKAAVGWRDDDAMALAAMACLADGGGNNGGCRGQLFSGSWCHHHHPIISVDSSGKDATAATAINCCLQRQWD